MKLYAINLHAPDGTVAEQHTQLFADDDAAIDHAGAIDHPHEMTVWQAGRLVAHFPVTDYRRSQGRRWATSTGTARGDRPWDWSLGRCNSAAAGASRPPNVDPT